MSESSDLLGVGIGVIRNVRGGAMSAATGEVGVHPGVLRAGQFAAARIAVPAAQYDSLESRGVLLSRRSGAFPDEQDVTAHEPRAGLDC